MAQSIPLSRAKTHGNLAARSCEGKDDDLVLGEIKRGNFRYVHYTTYMEREREDLSSIRSDIFDVKRYIICLRESV